MASALAAKIDSLGLTGSGGGEPLGLLNFSGIQTTAIGGVVDNDDLLDAIEDCRDSNVEANAYVLPPALRTSLAKLKSNSEANNYSAPPSDVSNLQMLTTTAMSSGTIVVGDFTSYIFGIRQEPMIEVSTEANEAFESHQVWLKIVWRVTFAAENTNRFVSLTGAT